MKIDINDHRKLFAIQEEFGNLFPNLRLEFYAKPAHAKGPHTKKLIESYAKTVRECRNIHNKGTLTIEPAMTVAGLQEAFRDTFGIEADVLKKNGNRWNDTTQKNELSLTEQNNNH